MDISGPGRPQCLGELPLPWAACKHMHGTAGMGTADHLQDQMGGGAESHQSQRAAVRQTRQAQGPVADGPRAEQRRGREIAELLRQGNCEFGRHAHVLGVAARRVPARSPEIGAEVFVPAPAMAAGVKAVQDNAFVEKSLAHNRTWRNWLGDELAALDIRPWPSQGNFLLASFAGLGNGDAAEAAESARQYLKEKYIRKAIDELPTRFKQVIILRDIQELSYEEVGNIINAPLGTVKSRLNRARLKLQEKLESIMDRDKSA